ncbi:hypothetical protein KTH_52790 [Thermosporothrix hazakensis]|nr:hypothetical protein KTH_52790 [Thermosporothrix hazakensis]
MARLEKTSSGGHDKWAAGASKFRTKRLDSMAYPFTAPPKIGRCREVGGMNDAVGCRCSAAQAVKIIEGTAIYLCTDRCERCGSGI